VLERKLHAATTARDKHLDDNSIEVLDPETKAPRRKWLGDHAEHQATFDELHEKVRAARKELEANEQAWHAELAKGQEPVEVSADAIPLK
jgi:hypothetical protein